jgi:hypothetical protein
VVVGREGGKKLMVSARSRTKQSGGRVKKQE